MAVSISSRRVNRLAKPGLTFAAFIVGLILIVGSTGLGCRRKAANEPAGAAFNLGKTETRSSLSSASTSSASDNSVFTSRQILFLAENPHPLSRRIAALLAQQLKDFPQIEQLETANPPTLLAEGAAAPDLFLRLNLVALTEDGILSRSMKATVAASLGSAPWQCNYYSQDATTPPLVHFDWDATLETESTFSGIRSDRYADAARSIADEIAKAVRKQIEDLSAKYPALPELPRDFYGPYQPVADFDFLKDIQARRACSYFDLLTHNQTFWQFQTATNPVPQLQRLISRLETAGWKISTANLTNTEDYLIRCRQGDDELEIFRQRTDRMSFPPPVQQEMDFVAHYRKPFSKAEREAVLEKLFAEPVAIESLLPFQNSFSPAQREKFYALVEKTPAASPRAYVQLADVQLRRHQTNAAVAVLLRAKALAVTLDDAAALDSDIEEQAKKISPKIKLNLTVTPETAARSAFWKSPTRRRPSSGNAASASRSCCSPPANAAAKPLP